MRRLVPAVALCSLALTPSSVRGTNVVGDIASNTEWTVAGSPYVVTAPVSVYGGVTLTVDSGVTVQFVAGAGLTVAGTLTAIGSSSSPIVFTSSAGTTAGSWRTITFTGGTSSSLSYATVSYGGADGGFGSGAIVVGAGSATFDHLTVSASGNAGIVVKNNGASLTLSNSTVTGSASYGLLLFNHGSASVSSTGFTGNGDYAISSDAGCPLTGMTGVTASANASGKDGVEFRGNPIADTETWLAGLDWFVTASPTVTASGNLTIGAGATVRFPPSTGLTVAGTLTAAGTSSSPIVLTSSSGAAAGSWRTLTFTGGTSNRLSYATVSYAGSDGGFGSGAINVAGGSASFDHLTVTASGNSGIVVKNSGSALTLSGSTVIGSASYGLLLLNSGSADVSSTSFLSNAGYALSTAAGCPLTSLTGITLSANGNGVMNGVEHRGGSIGGTETWSGGVPDWYLTSGVTVAGSATLNIASGITLHVADHQSLQVNGTLNAAGTAAAPIAFTPLSTSPTPGIWSGITFAQGSAGQVTYASLGYAGIIANTTTATLDHVTISNNSGGGIYISGGTPTPVIHNSAVSGNSFGMGGYPATPADARMNFWSDASGPSGAGPGSGQAVWNGFLFEPWLVAAPSAPQFFSAFSQADRTFNPTLGMATTLSFTTPLAGNWQVTVANAGGTVIRTLTGSSASANVAWDGKSDGGVAQANGIYTYQVGSTAVAGGAVASALRGKAIIDTSRQLTISSLAVTPLYFSPNNDGVQDTATVTATISFDDGWTLRIKNASGVVVRTATGTGGSMAYVWDGKDSGGASAPDGVYTLEVTATVGTTTAVASTAVTLDNTPPAVALTAPATGQLLSNMHQAGSAVITITGSAGDLNLAGWTLEYGAGSPPNSWITLRSGSASVAGNLLSWDTLALRNGVYTLRLRASDLAGNSGAQSVTLTVGNFSVSEGSLIVNAVGSIPVVYTSAVPFALTETLQIKNASGVVVRTLVSSAARSAGTYSDIWNGRGDAGQLLPDGPYFYIAAVQDGTSSMAWDLSNQYLNNYYGWNDNLNIQWFDPFNNLPMTFSYNFDYPGRVTIAFGPVGTPYGVVDSCAPPQFCLVYQKYEEPGVHSIFWAGVDPTGALRTDIHGVAVITERSAFAKNAVVMYGSKPSVLYVRVTPPIFGPATGTQTVSFDLSTNGNQPANVAISFLNQASLSVLRTISLVGVAPGHVTATWDGTADNGMPVAPGFYTVTVTVTDAIGNQASGQILTTIQY
ncbi:MAG TPA: FlgD immunoglobulin-like domain containing protein [Thermoanaerobaculia bacterium]|nr:FlgD immunoglobulin-like domain containing protein [Thermoanaerobaculia bacterium]